MLYSMTPTVSVMAGAIVNATKQAKIQVAGVPINLEYPNRVAEEYAMLDVMSGGRMEYAFPLGTGMEYWANAGTINPTTARARFRESLEVIVKAWTEDGPNRHDGDFYTYRFLNPFRVPTRSRARSASSSARGARRPCSSRSTTTWATRSCSCRSRISCAPSIRCASSPPRRVARSTRTISSSS